MAGFLVMGVPASPADGLKALIIRCVGVIRPVLLHQIKEGLVCGAVQFERVNHCGTGHVYAPNVSVRNPYAKAVRL
jgi:hypothetical protein